MYKLKKGVKPEILRRYGFKLGKEWPGYRNYNLSSTTYSDFWLLSTDLDDGKTIMKREDSGDPNWKIHLQKDGILFITVIPSDGYESDFYEMEGMFTTIANMLKDGIIYNSPR